MLDSMPRLQDLDTIFPGSAEGDPVRTVP